MYAYSPEVVCRVSAYFKVMISSLRSGRYKVNYLSNLDIL